MACVAAIVGACLALAACGGQTGRPVAAQPAAGHATSGAPGSASPLVIGSGGAMAAGGGAAVAAGGSAAGQRAGSRAGGASDLPATRVSARVRAEHAPSLRFYRRATRPTSDSEEAKPSHQRIVDPCDLVSRAQAQAILGTALAAPREAPLGPTCIYRGAHAFMTVSLQTRSFKALRAGQRSLHRFYGLRRQAWCGGTAGATTLFVRVAADRVLSVGAPCITAGRLAAHALASLERVAGVPVKTP